MAKEFTGVPLSLSGSSEDIINPQEMSLNCTLNPAFQILTTVKADFPYYLLSSMSKKLIPKP